MAIIEVSGLSKKYRIGTKLPYKTFRETIMNAITSPARLFKRNGSGGNNTIWAFKDASSISTDHSSYDYNFIAQHSRLIVDTRNAVKGGFWFEQVECGKGVTLQPMGMMLV
jgi:hypothetical protein